MLSMKVTINSGLRIPKYESAVGWSANLNMNISRDNQWQIKTLCRE